MRLVLHSKFNMNVLTQWMPVLQIKKEQNKLNNLDDEWEKLD